MKYFEFVLNQIHEKMVRAKRELGIFIQKISLHISLSYRSPPCAPSCIYLIGKHLYIEKIVFYRWQFFCYGRNPLCSLKKIISDIFKSALIYIILRDQILLFSGYTINEIVVCVAFLISYIFFILYCFYIVSYIISFSIC